MVIVIVANVMSCVIVMTDPITMNALLSYMYMYRLIAGAT